MTMQHHASRLVAAAVPSGHGSSPFDAHLRQMWRCCNTSNSKRRKAQGHNRKWITIEIKTCSTRTYIVDDGAQSGERRRLMPSMQFSSRVRLQCEERNSSVDHLAACCFAVLTD